MAIHWEYIKGANADSNSNVTYSFIKFTNSFTNNTDINNSPMLLVNNQNSSDTTKGAKELGYLLTTDALNQYITNDFTFKSNITLKGNIIFNRKESNCARIESNDGYSIQLNNKGRLTINNSVSNSDSQNAPLSVTGGAYIGKNMQIDGNLKVAQKVTITEGCQAQYFNATSDKRAKENIKSFNGNALDIINNINTYTFNYKNNPNDTNYGILAQDLLDININNFSFINNKEATGIEDDYMSVKETKLIYLLIEAVKEQQKEINYLKKELEVLKNA